jgi:excisionase family DNA binding protein
MSADVTELNLLTVRETAALLKQSERSVRRKVHSGQIPALRLGAGTGPLRIPADELEQWLYEDPAADFSGTSPQPVSPERRAPTVEGQSTAPVRLGSGEAA